MSVIDTFSLLLKELVLLITDPTAIILIFVGMILGIIWGAMPGLSTTMALALLIGVSAGMDQGPALAFLLSVYTGSTFGGSISAVFINIPGTPAAVCTAMEGFPLAKRGEGGQALGTAMVGSTIGNVIGIVILLLALPLVIKIALSFGSWEIFLMALWGLLLSGNLTAGSQPVKGWIAGFLGMLLGIVGMDGLTGIARFTFGSGQLMGGISFVPVLIGLFGVAEIFNVLPQKTPYTILELTGKILPPFKKFIKHIPTSLQSGVIGAIIGALPAMGADIAAYVAYLFKKQTASPEKFKEYGKGSYEGIVAAETANNASVAGTLLPLLTLGIPGSTVAAAFLGALRLHDIVVGPMITVQHPGLVEYMYAGLIMATIVMVICYVLIAKPMIKLLALPRELIMPIILIICVIGSFAVSNNFFDIWIMFVFGIFGFLLIKAEVPAGPMLMGIILGPMADVNFRRAMIIFEQNDSFLNVLARPVGSVLIILIIGTIIHAMFKSKQRMKFDS